MKTALYTDSKQCSHIHNIIAYALIHGTVCHADAEAFNPRCTVIRSRIPEIRLKYGWPIRNVNPPSMMACYSMNFKTLSEQACADQDLIERAARDWVNSGRQFKCAHHFIAFLADNYRRLIANEPMPTKQTAFWSDFAPMIRRRARQGF